MKQVWEKVARGLSDVVFPPVCVGCGALVEWEGREQDGTGPGYRYICARCAPQVEYVSPPCCTTCGHPFYGVVEGERMCPKCEGLDPAYREGCTAVLFKGPVRALVIELKYHRGLHVLADVRRMFAHRPRVVEWLRGAVLVPVPLHSRKERERGYNQAALLAQILAELAGHDTRVAPLLRRTVDTTTQTAFDRRTRMANLKNAFALAPGVALTPEQAYVIVDDVFTTGSTLNSCARVLRRGGALKLDVVTLAHG